MPSSFLLLQIAAAWSLLNTLPTDTLLTFSSLPAPLCFVLVLLIDCNPEHSVINFINSNAFVFLLL